MMKFNDRARAAAKRFLIQRGYDILETPWVAPNRKGKFDIVAQDGDALVFVSVFARKEGLEFPEERMNRKSAEGLALQYLASSDEDIADKPIRFDAIALVSLNNSHALLRHHVNCLGSSLEEVAATS